MPNDRAQMIQKVYADHIADGALFRRYGPRVVVPEPIQMCDRLRPKRGDGIDPSKAEFHTLTFELHKRRDEHLNTVWTVECDGHVCDRYVLDPA